MAQNLLTTGTGEVSSADFVLDGQKEATLSIRGNNTNGNIPSNALIYIELKDEAGNYWPVNILSSSQKMVLINAVGAYRVRRSASSGEAGVFYELGDTALAGAGGGGGTTNGLTDTQLRASAVPVSGPITNTELRAAAIPVSGPITDTQLRASALPVSLASQPLPTGASTSALQTTGNTSLTSIITALAGLLKVNTLAQPATARQLALSTTSASVQLTGGITRISILARGTDARYRLTATTSTALATDHYIVSGERLDLAVPSTWFISVLGTGTGTLEITELV